MHGAQSGSREKVSASCRRGSCRRRPRRGPRATYAALISALERTRHGVRGQAESRRADVPALEPARVRARGPAICSRHSRRRQLAAARHKSANFDNIAAPPGTVTDRSSPISTRRDAISRMAIGDRKRPAVDSTTPAPVTCRASWDTSRARVRTRALVVDHVFPADASTCSRSTWCRLERAFEDIEISIDASGSPHRVRDRAGRRRRTGGPRPGPPPRGADAQRPILIKAASTWWRWFVFFAQDRRPYETDFAA